MAGFFEFMHSVFDRSYVPEEFRKPVERPPENATKEQVAEHYQKLRDEANKANDNHQRIADTTEMVMGTIADAPVKVIDGTALAIDALAIIDPEPITKSGLGAVGAVLTAASFGLEAEKSYLLHNTGNNHAPLKTVFNTYIPPAWVLIGGDSHYYKGGNPLDHSLAHVEPPNNKNPLSHVPIVKELLFVSQQDVAREQAIKRLLPDGEVTLEAVDRDKDGVLTAKDMALIKQTLGNDGVADELFKSLQKQGVTFENQSLSSFGGAANNSPNHSDSNVPGVENPAVKPDFLSALITALVNNWDNVKDFVSKLFRGSSSSSPQVRASAEAMTPRLEKEGAAQVAVTLPEGLPNQLSIMPRALLGNTRPV